MKQLKKINYYIIYAKLKLIMSNQNINEINNEDISKIQYEIDTLEQKLFSDSVANPSLYEFNSLPESNNTNSIQINSQNISNNEYSLNNKTNEKLNEKSYKFNNNSFNKFNKKSKNDNIKIIENDEDDNNQNTNDKINKELKIKELLQLQKEIDLLREKKGEKIKKRLNKIYNNSDNRQKYKFKNNSMK